VQWFLSPACLRTTRASHPTLSFSVLTLHQEEYYLTYLARIIKVSVLAIFGGEISLLTNRAPVALALIMPDTVVVQDLMIGGTSRSYYYKREDSLVELWSVRRFVSMLSTSQWSKAESLEAVKAKPRMETRENRCGRRTSDGANFLAEVTSGRVRALILSKDYKGVKPSALLDGY